MSMSIDLLVGKADAGPVSDRDRSETNPRSEAVCGIARQAPPHMSSGTRRADNLMTDAVPDASTAPVGHRRHYAG